MGERELILDVSELHILSVECSKCGVGIVFDVSKQHAHLPDICPACKEKMELEGECLGRYRRFFQRVSEARQKFYFRVRKEDAL